MFKNRIIYQGVSNFSGPSGTRIEYMSMGRGYGVYVQPIEDAKGRLGEVWVDQRLNEFIVRNSGEAGVGFNYMIVR